MRMLFILCLLFSFQYGWTQELRLQVLGIAQDAGFPQIDCQKTCCKSGHPSEPVASVAIHFGDQFWIIDASPDFPAQLAMARKEAPESTFAGILLTHAHIGHYTGLMYLGRESMSSDQTPVYAMPRMTEFLSNNGPWSQLVSLNNIQLQPLEASRRIELSEGLWVTLVLVPHRDEFSETVAFHIETSDKSMLYLPDIDKWNRWDESITDWIERVDVAFLDATFYDGDELPGRDMSEVPHPFVVETLELLEGLNREQREKVVFIHFNHTNPLLISSPESIEVQGAGYRLARVGSTF